jgi:hypothetical protein
LVNTIFVPNFAEKILEMIREELIRYTQTMQGCTDKQAEDIVDGYLSTKPVKQRYIKNQVEILSKVLDKMLKVFDTPEDKMDFILDVCNGFEEELNEQNRTR